MKRTQQPLAALIIVLFWSATALSDGLMLNGVSPRSIGRGGTNIAFADNGAVLFDNPAGVVNIEGSGLVDLGFDLMLCDFRFENPRNDVGTNDSVLPLAQASLLRKSADEQWAYGVGLFIPAGFSEVYDMEGPPPLLSGRHRYKSFGSLAKALPGLAYQATDRLSIGATLGVAITHDELEGPYFIQGPTVALGTSTFMDLQATGAAPCWWAGMQFELASDTTLGLAYQSESRFRAAGSARLDVPGLGQTRYDSRLDVTWPRSLGLGVRHELCSHRIVSTDVIWYNWSKSFDDFGIHLSHPTNPVFDALYPTIYEEFPLRWHDTVSVRVGYEHLLCDNRAFRFGYVFHRNPIPNSTLTPFIQATFEHAVSAGYGCRWRKWDIDFSYMFAFGSEQTVTTSGLAGGDFDMSSHKAQAHAINFSLIRAY